MTLQVDPNDPEREQFIRMKIENRHSNKLKKAFREFNTRIVESFPEDFNPDFDSFDLRRNARLLRAEEDELYDILNRMLQESADLGVNVAIDQFETVGFGFDWTLANEAARDWAANYTPTLAGQINNTTERLVSQSVNRWIDNGEPLQDLIDDLTPIFGRSRAELISSTEVTRAYTEGNRIAYSQSGVVDKWEWRTAEDEKVCPICGPLSEKQRTIGAPFDIGIEAPPAHPRCRCWAVPVIDERK